jgi:hypothetical protein
VSEFSSKLAQGPIEFCEMCGVPITHQGMDIIISLDRIRDFGFNLSTEIMGVGLRSVMAIVLYRNDDG